MATDDRQIIATQVDMDEPGQGDSPVEGSLLLLLVRPFSLRGCYPPPAHPSASPAAAAQPLAAQHRSAPVQPASFRRFSFAPDLSVAPPFPLAAEICNPCSQPHHHAAVSSIAARSSCCQPLIDLSSARPGAEARGCRPKPAATKKFTDCCTAMMLRTSLLLLTCCCAATKEAAIAVALLQKG
ncbi:hypothetical protein J5N97_004874 [Dioscorea zingiberensis]|uniref:Uncharacterized protein n=1 Tax=Dioscorea zingiberensis TaxID=325984 RepID=A0A9D5D7G1_9LILI|nr:hypothetical protein J5N97_004874 [Dioscorea zingiberensis]